MSLQTDKMRNVIVTLISFKNLFSGL